MGRATDRREQAALRMYEDEQYGSIEAPRHPLLASVVEGYRNLGSRLEGSPAGLLYDEGLANYGSKLAYGDTPDNWDRLSAAGVLADVLPGGAALGAAVPAVARAGRSTIRGAERKAFPGIYKTPEELLADVQIAPESENLGRLFNTSRAELAEISNRAGNETGVLPGAAARPKGTAHGSKVMAPANTQRLVEALDYAKDTPLGEGMRGWYVMDPMYQRLVDLVGPEEAGRRYKQLNTLSGMASPGSDVVTEINRGSAANMLQEQGRFDDFVKYAGLPKGAGRPEHTQGIAGHVYHSTAQAKPMNQYLETGSSQLKSPKVPLYIQASSVPELGFQTDKPVGDAHWSRATGLSDVRGGKGYGSSFSNPEAQELAPWWRDDVAGQVGLESVPAQATAWGLFGPQTGVKTAVGAPKLELWADEIVAASRRLGVSPEQARDMILMGEAFTGDFR